MASIYGTGGSRSRQGAGGYVPAGVQRGRGTAVDAVGVALAPVARRSQQQREEEEFQRAAMQASVEAAARAYDPWAWEQQRAASIEANLTGYAEEKAARQAEQAEERQARREATAAPPEPRPLAERKAQAGGIAPRGAIWGRMSQQEDDAQPEWAKNLAESWEADEREDADERNRQARRLETAVAGADLSGLYADDEERDRVREDTVARHSTVMNGVLRPEELAGLTDRQKDMLVYLERQGVEDTQGKGFFGRLKAEGQNSLIAEQYARGVADQARERGRQQTREYLEDDEASPAGKAAVRGIYGANQIGENIKGTVEYLPELLGQQAKNLVTGKDEAVPTDSAGSRQQAYAGELAETALHDTSEAGRFVGQGLMSIGNNLANYALFGAAAPYAMGAQAGTDAAYDVAEQGGSGSQQMAMGVLSGAAEGLGEKVSLGGLEDILNTPVAAQGARQAAKEAGKRIAAQMGTEFTEEAATEAMNLLADAAVMQDEGKLAGVFDDYLAKHPGRDAEAVAFAAAEAIKQVLYAGAQGAFSGLVMGGGADAMSRMRAGTQGDVAMQGDAATEAAAPADALAEGEGPVQLEGEAAAPAAVQNAAGSEVEAGPAAVLAEGNGPVRLEDAGAPGPLTQNDTLAGEAEGAGGVPSVGSMEDNLPIGNVQAAQSGEAAPRTVRQEIVDSLPKLKKMGEFLQIKEDRFSGKTKTEMRSNINRFFDSLGNKVTRAGFGDVILNNRGIKDSLAHGYSKNKIAAFEAVPDIIRYGIVVDETKNFKGRGYDGVTFAAPIRLNGERVYMGVVVRKEAKSNRYYVHEVFDASGDTLKGNKKMQQEFSKPGGGNASLAVDSGTPAASSVDSIAENAQNINAQAAQSGEGGIVQEDDVQAREPAALPEDDADLTPAQRVERGRRRLEEATAHDPARDAELLRLREENARSQRTAERVEQGARLNEPERNYVQDLLRGYRSLDDAMPAALDAGKVQAVFEAKAAARETQRQVSGTRARRRQAIYDALTDVFAGSDNYTEKAVPLLGVKMPALYSFDTMERNIYDIVPDKAQARQIIDALFTPVHRHVADANLYKESLKQPILDLKMNNAEQVYTQILGELQGAEMAVADGLQRPEGELEHLREAQQQWLERNEHKIDMQKVEQAIELYRDAYDVIFDDINASLVRNGYEPVPYRRGYFPHQGVRRQDGLLGKVGEVFGIRQGVDEIPTSIAGLTETFRPGVQWFANRKQRRGFETEYHAGKGLDAYLETAADVIYLTDDIQTLRQAEKVLRDKYTPEEVRERQRETERRLEEAGLAGQAEVKAEEIPMSHLSGFVQELGEYTNLLAGKKSKADRLSESQIGRKVYEAARAVDARVAANMVGLNISTNITNFIPLQQAAAELSPSAMAQAFRDTMRKELRQDLKVAESAFLTNRDDAPRLYRSAEQVISDTLSKPITWIDPFVAGVVTRGRFYDNMRSGMERQQAIAEADAWAASLMADRSKGAMPTYMQRKNPNAKATARFQLEVNNQLRHLFKDIPRDMKGKGLGALAMVFIKYLVGAKLFNDLFVEVAGRRPALDPLGITNEFVGDMTGYQLPTVGDAIRDAYAGDGIDFTTEQQEAGDAWKGLGENVLDELPFISGNPLAAQALSLAGLDVEGGRIPVGSAIPKVGTILEAARAEADPKWKRQQIGKELAKPLYYFLPPFGGGQAKKTIEAIPVMKEGGSYTYDKEGNRLLRYAVEDLTPIDRVKMLTFGQWANPAAQEFAEGGFNVGSMPFTDTWHAARDAGVKGEQFRDAWNTAKGAEADKDAEGESINGTKQANMAAALRDMEGLDGTQKLIVLSGTDKGLAEKVEAATSGGADPDVVLDWLARQKEFTSDLDENGAAISGSRQAKIYAALDDVEATPAEKMGLLRATMSKDSLEELDERMADAVGAGVEDGTLYTWLRKADQIAPDKTGEGDSISGSRDRKILAALEQLDATPEQKLALLEGTSGYGKLEERMEPARAAGVDDAAVYDWWAKTVQLAPDRGEEGEAISGSKRQKAFDMAMELEGLSATQRLALLDTVPSMKLAEELEPYREFGLDDEVLLNWWAEKEAVEADVWPDTGKTVENSRLANVARAAWNQGLDVTDTFALIDAASGINTYELLEPARAAGVPDNILLDWIIARKDFYGDKTASGKYVKNSKKDKARAVLYQYDGLSYEQANELMKLVSKSYDGKW